MILTKGVFLCQKGGSLEGVSYKKYADKCVFILSA